MNQYGINHKMFSTVFQVALLTLTAVGATMGVKEWATEREQAKRKKKLGEMHACEGKKKRRKQYGVDEIRSRVMRDQEASKSKHIAYHRQQVATEKLRIETYKEKISNDKKMISWIIDHKPYVKDYERVIARTEADKRTNEDMIQVAKARMDRHQRRLAVIKRCVQRR